MSEPDFKLFKPGDVVYLRSGSDKLTVASATKDLVEVAWWSGSEIRSMSCPPEVLTIKQPDRREPW